MSMSSDPRALLTSQVGQLSSAQGHGTSMISLYVSPSSPSALPRARARLNEELGVAGQIQVLPPPAPPPPSLSPLLVAGLTGSRFKRPCGPCKPS